MQPPIPDPHAPPQAKPRFWFAFWQVRWYLLLLLIIAGFFVLAVEWVTETIHVEVGIVKP